MRGFLRSNVWVVALSLVAAGCSSGTSSGGPTGGSGSPDAGGGEVDNSGAAPAERPLACDEEGVSCVVGLTCRSGVCIADPLDGEVAVLTDATGLVPYPVEAAPNLACVGEPTVAPEGPATATLYGAVSRFGSGLITTAVQVEVFVADQWDPEVCEAIKSTEAQADCYREYGAAAHAETYGLQPVGSALSVKVSEEGSHDECKGHGDCSLGYECLAGDLDSTCLEQFGLYSIPDVPTNTSLIIRTHATTNEKKWHDVYTFGVYLFADGVTADGRYHHDVTIVSTGQWELTANIAGLGEIPEERGAIGGRVRDCRVVGACVASDGTEGGACTLDADCVDGETCSDGRASWPIGGVVIGLADPPAEIVYFNKLEDDTVPLDFRTTTNILGRYAALDIPAGWNTLAGAVRVQDEVVSVGAASVYVVPDALSIVGWPGLQPHWRQE